MQLEIFDVEHGACALLTCDNNARIMIDCGHNASTSWRPGTHLNYRQVRQIEMLAVTNYDEDHVSGIEDLRRNVTVLSLLRNKSVSPDDLRQLKSEDGMGRGIEILAGMMRDYMGPPLSINYAGLEYKVYMNAYPTFDDENNLSLVLFLKCHNVGVLFPGDLEKAGWLVLMRDQNFISSLKETNVLVAPHHGRMSGWCDELRQNCNPHYVVISDKGYEHDTQETLHLWRSITKGGPFRGEARHVLTTRRDGMITFEFAPDSWGSR